MLKKLLLTFIILTAIVLGITYKIYSDRPIMTIPYAFTLEPKLGVKLKELEETQVLVIGDQLTHYLEAYFESMSQNLSKGITKKFKFLAMGSYKDNLTRTLNKLKTLPTLPPIIIYHGGSYEFYEKKFHLPDYQKIINNISLYKNDSVKRSLIFTYPIISKFLYEPVKQIQLSETPPKQATLPKNNLFIKHAELIYQFYEYELKELVSYINNKKSKIILLSSPVNLDFPPDRSCQSEKVKNLDAEYSKVIELNKNGQFKDSLKYLENIKVLAQTDPFYFYLLGQTYKKQGQIAKAKNQLVLSNALDCRPGRMNQVINKIIAKVAYKTNTTFVDFNGLILNEYGTNTLFETNTRPQHIYYQKALSLIIKRIKQQLNL